MTKQTFDIAKDILADINSLKNIKGEYNDDHYISFYGETVKEQRISSGILRDDLEKFIDMKIAELEDRFERL